MDLPKSGDATSRFLAFVEGLTSVIGHADRAKPLRDYCIGLMMPGERKSVEPMAAITAPERTAAQHQSLLHFVGEGTWSDEKVLAKVRELFCRRTFVMSGSSRFSQLISAEAGEIERRLQALEKRLNIAGARASTNAWDTAENLGDAIASALTGWADRFRQGASTVGDQSAALGRDAARLGTVAVNRIADETGRRPLFALAVAIGVGILIGMAARNSSR